MLVNAGQVCLVSHDRRREETPTGKRNAGRRGRGSRSTESNRTGNKNSKQKT